MSKLMLIDAAHAEETRVVVTDNGRVEEFDFESQARKQLRGNIYLAKVTRVEPSLQAAFIEYGGNRHGFLAFNEIHPDYYQIPLADREALMRDLAEDSDDGHDEPLRANGDDAENGENGENGSDHDSDEDVMDQEVERRRRRLLRKYKIQEVIKRRQIMLVQVVKEERGNKGAALTTYLSLAGRYGVLMPNTARGGGISRKITAASDRKRLKGIVQGLDVPAGMGLIIRTAGAKRTKTEIQRDYEYLLRAWENIRETTMHSIAPALIYAEEDLVKRAIRDMFDKDIDAVIVEGEKGYKEARDFMRMLMPSQAKKISQHRDPTPLFVKYKVEDHLSQIYSPVVPLKSGGYLVINQTEALVAIDVNSGKSTRERNIEATALKTNLEAAEEACRQLRLRDLAGLIVIDFIDMDEPKNNRAVEKRLKEGLATDRARVQMGKISTFGLMEISRQRRRTGILEGTTHVCERCGGTGRVRTAESSALSALRAVELEAVKGAGSVTLRVPRAVGLYILNEKRAYLERLNQTLGLFVTVLIDDAIAHSEHAIERTSHAEGFTRPVEEAVVEDEPDFEIEDEEEEDEDVLEAESEEEDADGEDDAGARREGGRGRGRRRRRGRGGRDEARAEPSGEREHPDDEEAREGDGHGGRRRRRRGRRGGRRAREEFRTDDAYAWARMRAPDGDPYVWLDPADVLGGGVTAANDEAPAPAAAQAEGGAGEEDIWVELPPREDSEPRSGRRRGRGRGRDRDRRRRDEAAPGSETVEEAAPAPQAEAIEPEAIAPEAVEPEAVEPAPVVEPVVGEKPARGRGRKKAEAAPEVGTETPAAEAEEKKPARRSRAKKAAEPAPEPVVEAAPAPAPEPEAAPEPATEPQPGPEPVAAAPAPKPVPAEPDPAEPDPAEIVAPPPVPRRGWWRRG